MRNIDDLNLGHSRDKSPTDRERLLNLLLATETQRRHSSRTISPRGPQDGVIPVSYAQERLWFLDQMGLVGAAYNVPLALRLSGELLETDLENSLTELVHRHESLRTRFEVHEGVPHQVIDAPQPFELRRIDLSDLRDSPRERQLREWVQGEHLNVFDLRKGPLFRGMLVKLTDQAYVLLLTLHHIVVDGWSLGVLVRELSTLYAAAAKQEPHALPKLPIQYADYAIWQRQRLQGEVLQKQLEYWRQQLLDAPPRLQLLTDRARPAVESFKGATLKFQLPANLSRALKELARGEGATLFMIALAAYQILLSRWSGQDDIVVGSPIAGRSHSETDGLIGFFVNTLALRTDLSGNPTFRELLRRVKAATLGAFAHQDLPFDLLVKELRPDRTLTRQPIFQVMLAVQNFPEESLELPGLTWNWSHLDWVTTHFELSLFLSEGAEGLTGLFEYATDLFEPQTIQRMAEQLQILLSAVVEDPERPIRQLPLLTDAQKQQLLVQWNATSTAYPREACVHDLFAAQAARNPQAIALEGGGLAVSYAELNARANRLAHQLIARGVRPDTVVGIYLERSIEMVVGFLGVLKAGGAYLPLDPTFPLERLTFMLEEAGASIVLTSQALLDRLPATVSEAICLDSATDPGLPDANPCQQGSSDQLAYVLYTSGSTGRPKAVGVVHRNIVRLLVDTDYIDIGAQDVFLQLSSPAFDASTFEIWGALLHGGKLVLYPEREVDLDHLQPLLQRHQVNVLWLTAGLFHQVIDERPEMLASVRCLLAGGDALSVSHVKRACEKLPGCRLINGYGPTEATTFSVCYSVNDAAALETTVPIGRPIANSPVYVLDEYLQPLPVGVGGELYIAGDGVARGYLNRPGLTAERFVENPFGPPRSRMYRTGDLVRWRSDRTLEFLGRIDNQVKLRGFRIEPAEIEIALLEHPAVKQALVLAREDRPGDKRLVAYVVGDRHALEATPTQTPETLRKLIVGEWETLYEETYRTEAHAAGPSFIGWNSSYTGHPIPESEMREWLASTIERISALRPKRVLEIGCGVGLLLQHLAPHCEVYVGTDFSAAALERLRSWMHSRADLAHVELLHRSATELSGLDQRSFDTIILNSVVQYFPDVDYLLTVLQGAAGLLGDSGQIFIGDVRHLGSLPMFHSAVQLGKAAASVNVRQLKRRISRAVSQDKELVIAPQFFQRLAETLPNVAAMRVCLKRGHAENELTRYRYDVTLQLGAASGKHPDVRVLDWRDSVRSLDDFETALQRRRWNAVHLIGIPNSRLAKEAALQKLLETSAEQLEIGLLRRQASEIQFDSVDPDEIWVLAQAHGYHVVVSPGEDGSFEAQLWTGKPGEAVGGVPRARDEAKPWSAYANDPMEHGFKQQLVPQLREYLKTRLPKYMIPSAWLVLKELPLTPNGKVDRRALPAPQGRPEELGEYIEPGTELERVLADIWSQLLQVDQVGVQDNFFELGGHSLLIVNMMERLRRRGLSAKVRDVYESPTLADLARALTESAVKETAAPLSMIPVGCEALTPQMLSLIDLQPHQIERIVQSVPGGAANIQDIYPLAPLQEGILFHHLLEEKGGDAYVVPLLLSLSSRGRFEEFVSALQAVINRHDILRTAVFWEGLPRSVQVVYRTAPVPVREIQLDHSRDPMEQLKERLRPGCRRLDLHQAPLMWLEVAPDPHSALQYVLLYLHHLVCDAKSMDTMLAEVMAYMDGRAQGLIAPAPYRNHVAEVLEHERTDETEAFFRNKLKDVDEPSAPFGLLDVHGDGSQIVVAHQIVDAGLAKRIRIQARRLSVSAATLFHAAWGLVVSRTTGRDDVVVGSVLLGRMQGSAGAQRALGMFINTLPLRIRLHAVSAKELVEQTQRELVELLNHEQASLAVAQRCSGVSGSTPLFSTLVNYRHSAADLESDYVSAAGVTFLTSQTWTNYPIMLSVNDQGEGFELQVDADRGVDAHRITDYLRTAIESLVEALEERPRTPALSLSILPARERREVLEGFNAPWVPYAQEKLIQELFEEEVRRRPDATAVEYEGRSLSYAVLNRRANQLARYLVNEGVGPDKVVGICVERSLEMVVGLLAILKAGGAYLPLDPNYPSERLQYMLEDGRPQLVLTQEELRGVLPGGTAPVIALDVKLKEIAAGVAENLPPPELGLEAHHLVYVIYTSGSTGQPKGTGMAHRSMVNLIEWHRAGFGPGEGRRVLQFAALSFDVAFQETFSTLCTGGTLVLLGEWVRRDTPALAQFLSNERIERLFVPPLMLQSLAESCAGTSGVPQSLQDVITAGEALRISPEITSLFKRLPGCRLHNHYGPTETHVVTALTLSGECDHWPAFPSIGRPISNTRLYVLDGQGEPVPIGVVGEIYIGGVAVARGYLGREELTAQRFVHDPYSADPQARLYKSGDLGRWRTDGTLEYVGRNDDQVKIRGYRIELGEIEAQLAGHEDVREAAVVVRQEGAGEKRLVAYVTARAARNATAEELRAHLKGGLPEYMIPSAFVTLERLPLTPSGKLDRRALPVPGLEAYASREYATPQGEIEPVLAGIWRDLLKLEQVGRHDNFFELGGHSLHVMKLNVRVKEHFGVGLSLPAIFKHPTVQHMASAVESLRGLQRPSLRLTELEVEEGTL